MIDAHMSRRKASLSMGIAKCFFEELQEEAFEHKLEEQNKLEVLGDVAGAAQRLWTSAKTMRYCNVCVCLCIDGMHQAVNRLWACAKDYAVLRRVSVCAFIICIKLWTCAKTMWYRDVRLTIYACMHV